MSVIMGILAMVLIYLVTVKLPDIAALIDRTKEKPKEDDGVTDIYQIQGSDADDKENNDG
ncbi:MAG: hypothetical protein IJ251_07800 [Oscillospiraceae bacterium]|nr:hypothetical protein [Oscillospiraceae bacterium]